jgi:hypothetical protein
MNSDVAKIRAETWLEEIAGFEIERLAAGVYDVFDRWWRVIGRRRG